MNSRIETLQKEIKTLDLKQNAIKILINSFYGAFGNRYFYFHNNDIAQSITLQGQDLIKFAIKAINHYFANRWHLDTELHTKLGISGYKINKIENEAAIYTDTDSVYSCIEFAFNSIEGLTLTDEQALQMVVDINEYRLRGYFEAVFEKYAEYFHTQNRQNFELESISRAGIYVAKKKYVLEVVSKGAHLRKKPDLLIKGLEAIQASYPIWARDNLKKIYWLLLDKGYTLDLEADLIPLMSTMRADMEQLALDDIAFNFSVRVFEEHLKSLNPLVMEKGMPIYGRASAYHNHVIKKTKSEKYPMIRSGSKIKFYYADPHKNEYDFDIFAYPPGNVPDFVIPIDKDHQFFRLIVEPINKLLTAMGFCTINDKLTRHVEVIKTRSRAKVITEDDMYPLYAVDSITLKWKEIPKECEPYIGNSDMSIPDEIFPTYLAAITTFGLSTVIVPKFELYAYLQRMGKKLEIEVEDPFALPYTEMASFLVENGWETHPENDDMWLKLNAKIKTLEKAIPTKNAYGRAVRAIERAEEKTKQTTQQLDFNK